MSSKPTVTVGISAYNEEHAFPALLESLLKQSQTSFVFEKIIVVSDGSTDNTVKNKRTYQYDIDTSILSTLALPIMILRLK